MDDFIGDGEGEGGHCFHDGDYDEEMDIVLADCDMMGGEGEEGQRGLAEHDDKL